MKGCRKEGRKVDGRNEGNEGNNLSNLSLGGWTMEMGRRVEGTKGSKDDLEGGKEGSKDGRMGGRDEGGKDSEGRKEG